MTKPSKDILDDLCMRFVLNCPDEELMSWERLLFQVSSTHTHTHTQREREREREEIKNKFLFFKISFAFLKTQISIFCRWSRRIGFTRTTFDVRSTRL